MITVEIPHPDVDTRYKIGRELVVKNFGENQDGSTLDFDTIPNDIRIIARDSNTGRITFQKSYTATNWNAISELVEDIRLRLSKLDLAKSTELLDKIKRLKHTVENLRFKARDAYDNGLQEGKRIAEERVQREEYMEFERVRDTLGLETGTRRYRDMESVARIRLSRWSEPTISRAVRNARAALGVRYPYQLD